MKSTRFFRLFLGLIFFQISVSQAGDVDVAPHTPKAFVDDGAYLFTSPLRLNRENYKTPLICASVVVGAAFFDEEIREKLFNWRNTDPSEDLRKLGDYGQVAGPVIGTFFAIHGWAADNDKSKETAYLAYESFIWAGTISGVMKFVIGRERPSKTDDPYQFTFGARDSSFPSGHTTTAFAAATVFSEQYPHWYVYVPAYGGAAAVGFSRMYANQHWFSDVVAGAMLGTSVSHILRKRHRRSKDTAWDFQIDPAGMRLVRTF